MTEGKRHLDDSPLFGLKIGSAVVFTLLVVASALRLLAYRDGTRPGDVRG